MDITSLPITIEKLRYKKRKKIIKYFMSIGMPRNMAEREAEWIKLTNKLRTMRWGIYKND